MARITVEDCLDKIDNRFKLIMVASKRARQIATGSEPLVGWENDKPTVVALREIADGLIDEDYLKEAPPVSSEELFNEELEEANDAATAALHAEIGQELSQLLDAGDNNQATAPDESEQSG